MSQKSPDDPSRLSHYIRLLPCFVFFAIFSVFAIIAILFLDSRAAMSGGFKGGCGTSPAEARHLGCKFDIMTYAWLPPACYDHELTKEFQSLSPWEWSMNGNGSQQLSTDAVEAGDVEMVYGNWRYQIMHCTYAWRKFHRAVLHGWPLDGYIRDYHHTAHCELTILTAAKDLNATDTSVYIKYPVCGGQDLGRFGWYRMISGNQTHRLP
jgi:hypothetical protein